MRAISRPRWCSRSADSGGCRRAAAGSRSAERASPRRWSSAPGLGTKLLEIWAAAALGELELGLGNATRAAEQFEDQQRLLSDLEITDADLSPAPELVDTYLRLGRCADATRLDGRVHGGCQAKGQPWSIARALRCRALVAPDADIDGAVRTGVGLSRADTGRLRDRAHPPGLRRAPAPSAQPRARPRQLNAAIDTFERLDARPWIDRARAELAATGVTVRRRDPSTIDDLTPQELQIAVLLAGGKTTRENATALFLSPKTIEYHLRHVYQKLAIHSREELGRTLATGLPDAPVPGGMRRQG